MTKRTTAIIIAIVIIVAAVIAIISSSRSHSVIPSSVDSADGAVKAFLEMMIPHHKEAVDTSLVMMEDKTAPRVDVKLIAGRIFDAQTFEIIQMKGWYVDWFGAAYDASSTIAEKPYMPMMNIAGLTGEALEQAYLKDMIHHHQMAVDASEEFLAFIAEEEKENSVTDGDLTYTNSHQGIDQTVLFAKKIIETQSKEIAELSSLRDLK